MLDRATIIFNEMREQGVKPDVVSYYCLIQGFCIHGGLLKAKELVLEMMKKGMRPKS